MSAMGQKRTFERCLGMSAFGLEPDLARRSAERPLSAISRHPQPFDIGGLAPGAAIPDQAELHGGRLVFLASLGNLIGRQRRCACSEPAGHKVDDSGDFRVGIAIAKPGHEFFA
jgi:hypothetical protein